MRRRGRSSAEALGTDAFTVLGVVLVAAVAGLYQIHLETLAAISVKPPGFCGSPWPTDPSLPPIEYLGVTFTDRELVVRQGRREILRRVHGGDGPDLEALENTVRGWVGRYPGARIVWLHVDDDVTYGDAVRVLDTLRGPGCSASATLQGERPGPDCWLDRPIVAGGG